MQQQRRTLCGDALCFLLITPLASLSGWLCVQGAMDLYYTNGMEALGLLVLTLALFTIYVFWTMVSSELILLIHGLICDNCELLKLHNWNHDLIQVHSMELWY